MLTNNGRMSDYIYNSTCCLLTKLYKLDKLVLLIAEPSDALSILNSTTVHCHCALFTDINTQTS